MQQGIQVAMASGMSEDDKPEPIHDLTTVEYDTGVAVARILEEPEESRLAASLSLLYALDNVRIIQQLQKVAEKLPEVSISFKKNDDGSGTITLSKGKGAVIVIQCDEMAAFDGEGNCLVEDSEPPDQSIPFLNELIKANGVPNNG